MRKLLFIFCLFSIILNCSPEKNVDLVIPEKIYEGNVILPTQEAVDEFGEQQYTQITGCLSVGVSDSVNASITRLDKLKHLTSIGGGLIIQNNNLLTSIDALSNCKSFGDSLVIKYNEALNNLGGLRELNELNKLAIISNPSLYNLSGLESLTKINGDFLLIGNEELVSIREIATLSTLKGRLSIESNTKLPNIDGLGSITKLRNLTIGFNQSLEDVDGLSNLEVVEEIMTILANDNLSSLQGMSKISSVGILLDVSGNNSP
jgi:hypothetical protein